MFKDPEKQKQWRRLRRSKLRSSIRPELTSENLKNALRYDPDTGVFTHLKNCGSVKVGDVAGTLTTSGYVSISVREALYLAHRLAWLYMTGEWPSQDIDHIDTNPRNNSWQNLRLANRSQNAFNTNKMMVIKGST